MTNLAYLVSVVLLILAAGLRAAGASLVRTNRADALHDAADGVENAAIVANLLEDRAGLQPSLGIVHIALLISATVPAAWAVSVSETGRAARAAALVGVAIIVLFGGDILPRSLGRSRPRRLAYRFAGGLRRAARLGAAANDLVEDADEDADEDVESETFGREEKELISSVIEFSDTLVREVMVPRPDMLTISSSLTSEEALDAVIANGYSRIPVSGVGVDDILGTVYAKDLLRLMDEGGGPVAVKDLMRPAYFVPETKKVAFLLRDMQTSQIHMAIVVDEFGGTSGLVTIEDLLEELVGEIADEYDTEEPMVVPDGQGGLLVDARLSVEELSTLVREDLPSDEWDTVGGLVLGLAGRVPREGEAFEFGDIVLRCVRVQGRRIAKVRVNRPGEALIVART